MCTLCLEWMEEKHEGLKPYLECGALQPPVAGVSVTTTNIRFY